MTNLINKLFARFRRRPAPSEREVIYQRFQQRGECPFCDQSDLLEGPRGGLSVNAICGCCGARFNVHIGPAGIFGVDLTHGPTGDSPAEWDDVYSNVSPEHIEHVTTLMRGGLH